MSGLAFEGDLAELCQEPRELQPGVDTVADADMAKANLLQATLQKVARAIQRGHAHLAGARLGTPDHKS